MRDRPDGLEHADFTDAWLHELKERAGARRWVLLVEEAGEVSVETETLGPTDKLYPAVWEHLVRLGDGLHHVRAVALGDTGRRLAATGVEQLVVWVAGGDGVVLVLETDDVREGELTPGDLLPSPELVASRGPDLLRVRRRSSDLLNLRQLLKRGVTDLENLFEAGTDDLLTRLLESAEASSAVVLDEADATIRCRASWTDETGEVSSTTTVMADWTWADVARDPLAALDEAAERVGASRARPWRHAIARGGHVLLGLVSGTAVPSQEGLDLYVGSVIAADSWRAAMSAAQRNAHLAERARLAMAIHEGGIQHLTNVAVQLEIAGDQILDEAVRSELASARAAVLDAIDSLRKELLDMAEVDAEATPKFLTRSLEQAVVDYSEEWDLDIDFSVEGTVKPVPETGIRLLHDVTYESLVNIRRHSGRTSGSVTVRFHEDAVAVEIADEGAGFDPDEIATRPDSSVHGLGLLRSEARHARSTFEVDSAVGAGTTVRCTTPL